MPQSGAWETFRQLDEFLRLYQLGFVAIWPLLGLAGAHGWTARPIVALVAISLAFNVFGGVLNDLCDLESDRHAQERSDRWLIAGIIPGWLARGIVVAQLPIMLAIHLAAGFRTASLGWLAAALVGQAWYDILGKRSRIPPLAEAGQAVAAGCLVMYGATSLAADPGTLALPTATAGAALLLLVNAFHGGLRDIGDDLVARVHTTPIWLGCGVHPNHPRISAAMSAYGAWWLAVLVAASMAVAYETMARLSLITSLGSAINVGLFIALHRVKKPAWDAVLRLHVGLLTIPIMAAFFPLLGVGSMLALLADVHSTGSASRLPFRPRPARENGITRRQR